MIAALAGIALEVGGHGAILRVNAVGPISDIFRLKEFIVEAIAFPLGG